MSVLWLHSTCTNKFTFYHVASSILSFPPPDFFWVFGCLLAFILAVNGNPDKIQINQAIKIVFLYLKKKIEVDISSAKREDLLARTLFWVRNHVPLPRIQRYNNLFIRVHTYKVWVLICDWSNQNL